LSLSALVAVYFLARQFAGNFFVFFLWLAYLPFSYATNLWFYFAEPLRGGAGSWNWIQFLPQFGGLHAFSLGMVQDFYRREAAWSAVANLGLWTAAAQGVAGGFQDFSPGRLVFISRSMAFK